jgi:hypothetical protein
LVSRVWDISSGIVSYFPWLDDCANFMPTPEENTNSAPTTIIAIQAQANPRLSMNNYTPHVISRNDKNKQLTLLRQRKLALSARNTLFEHWSTKKIYKNGPVLHLGLKLTAHVIKSQIHLVKQSLKYF